MRKEDIQKMPPYFDRYIALADDKTVIEVLQTSLEELENAPLDTWRLLGDKVYEEGKWTVKDMLQHYIDTERVFGYRILAIARGDKQKMIPYDEEEFGKNAKATRRPLEEILDELILLRKSTIAMFQSFDDEMLTQLGNGFNGMQYCPLSLGFMLAGHQRWHFNVLEERYYPLV